MYPTTPDGQYFVVKGQLWRCTYPSLNEDVRQRLVDEPMEAQREVKAEKALGDPGQLKLARASVQTAKVALGERGTVWWDDGSADFNTCQVANTPYADWYRSLSTVRPAVCDAHTPQNYGPAIIIAEPIFRIIQAMQSDDANRRYRLPTIHCPKLINPRSETTTHHLPAHTPIYCFAAFDKQNAYPGLVFSCLASIPVIAT